MNTTDRKKVIRTLKENGFKVTPQRLAICMYVISSNNHPSAVSIYKNLLQDYPSLSKGTVYKTLDLLLKVGLVKSFCVGDGLVRFDPNTKLHINLICSDCGKIVDYQSSHLDEFWGKLSREIGLKPLDQRIDFIRRCQDCQD